MMEELWKVGDRGLIYESISALDGLSKPAKYLSQNSLFLIPAV